MLIRHRDDRAGEGLVGVRRRPARARVRVANALARDLLEQKLRGMAGAVVAHVDDQCREVALGAELAVELGVAGGHHVGQGK